MGAAETSEFVVRAAFLDLQKDATNNKKLLELVRYCYVNTLKMSDLCASLRINAQPPPLIHEMLRLYAQDNGGASFQVVSDDALIVHDHFFHELSRLYAQQLMMRDLLQSFHVSSVEKLDAIDTRMNVSSVFFTAAAALTAAMAGGAANSVSSWKPAVAAGTSILFLAVGKWIHSLLKKRERAVKKHMNIIGVMNMGADFIIKDLSSIHAAARSLQFQTESFSEIVAESDDDVDVLRKKVAAVKKSFEDLRAKINDFSGDMRWARNIVLQNIITLSY